MFAFGQPPILGLGASGGFEFMMQDRSDAGVAKLNEVTRAFIAAASKRPEIASVSTGFRATVPQYRVDLDTDKVQTLGVPIADVYSTLQTFLGGLYVNDFNRFGRTWRVMMQAEPEFRRSPDDIDQFFVRTAGREMVPLSHARAGERRVGTRRGLSLQPIPRRAVVGRQRPGLQLGTGRGGDGGSGSRGAATRLRLRMDRHRVPATPAEGQEPITFGFAAVLVLLFLAALYESWTIPFAVVLAVPLGMFGALGAVTLRGYAYDIYTQIGIVTLIGLAAKNAILIVEYAKLRREQGESVVDAALDAAHAALPADSR